MIFLSRRGKKYFIDILKHSTNVQSIYIQIGGLFIAGIIKSIFATISSRIELFHFIISLCGDFLACIPVFMAMAASSIMFLKKTQNNHAVTAQEAISLASEKLYPIVISLVKIFCAILIIFMAFFILNYLVKIPYLGELLWPVFCIPNFIFSIAIILIIPLMIIFIHFLPGAIILSSDDNNALNKIFSSLKNRFPVWIPVLAISSFTGLTIMFFHYITVLIQNHFSELILREKFFQLIIAIPKFPGYLLLPLTKYLFPFDFVNNLSITYGIGGFLWGLIMFVITCAVYGIVFNIWNSIGVLYFTIDNPENPE